MKRKRPGRTTRYPKAASPSPYIAALDEDQLLRLMEAGNDRKPIDEELLCLMQREMFLGMGKPIS